MCGRYFSRTTASSSIAPNTARPPRPDLGAPDASPEERAPPTPHLAQALLLPWYDSSARDLPWRRTRDAYAVLVSEVMLQQTQVERVIPKYEQFLARFPTLASLAEASTADVIRIWSPLGYNRRAINLQRLARTVVAEHDGRLPEDVNVLRSFPGIGRYTAAAVACFAFGRREPVVDTNIRRVLNRLQGGSDGATSRAGEIERLAAAYLPEERAGDWSQALMDLGATLCRAVAPTCLLCPLRSICPSRGAVVRESRPRYGTVDAEPFKASDRYLRGRIVDHLRALPPGESVPLPELRVRLARPTDEPCERLDRLLRNLERDGLVTIDAGDPPTIRLPA